MSKSCKFIYFGTPNFSADVLEILISNNLSPLAVVTQPDKKVGRKRALTQTPVKINAQKHSIPVYSPVTFDKYFTRSIKAHQPDVLIVYSYGKILPDIVLAAAPYGALNIHPSLLPKYRGPSPVAAAILNSETETGVTIIKLDSQMDRGPIVAQKKIAIEKNETNPELTSRLSATGAELLIKILPDYCKGKVKLMPQDHKMATFSKTINKEDGKIDWQKSAQEIYNQYRAFLPWPGVFTFWKGKRLKLTKINILKEEKNSPGSVFKTSKGDFAVGTKKGAIGIVMLQLQGKKTITANEFIMGHQEIIGQSLGN